MTNTPKIVPYLVWACKSHRMKHRLKAHTKKSHLHKAPPVHAQTLQATLILVPNKCLHRDVIATEFLKGLTPGGEKGKNRRKEQESKNL